MGVQYGCLMIIKDLIPLNLFVFKVKEDLCLIIESMVGLFLIFETKYDVGVLAVTRSLGDTSMKEWVIGSPYTTETVLDDQDDCLVLACDGVNLLFNRKRN